MILNASGGEFQPINETYGGSSRTTIMPSQTSVVARSGSTVTYTPLYNSALYDSTAGVTWFEFPAITDARQIRVTVISADGHTKEKLFDARILSN